MSYRPKVLLVGLYDTNTAALAPEILRSYVSRFPIAAQFDIQTLNLSIFSQTAAEMTAAIQAVGAQIVGFSTYIWNIQPILQIIPHLDGTVILGGPQCNDDGQSLLAENPDIDIVVTGEGEETFKELLEHFSGERPLEQIRGVTTRAFKAPPRPVLPELDSVPSPYPAIFQKYGNLEWVAYETSRGCPFLCGFCTWGFSKKMRYHSLDRVFADLDILLSQPSLERIYLCDSSILLQKERAKAILKHIISRNKNLVLRYEFNAEHLDDEIITLLLQLSENEFNFGVQTINPAALKIMRRPFHRAKFEENFHKMAQRTKRTSITMDLIYGLPGDDLRGFMASIDYVMSFDRVKWILTNPLILLPGSDYRHDAVKHGIRLRDRESCIVESTASFPLHEMEEAIKLSFWLSVVYFNERFREAVRSFAKSEGHRYVDTLIALFDGLPFPLLDSGPYPYMVPSVTRDFRTRNLAIFRVIHLYPSLIRYFNEVTGHRYAEALADYPSHFVDQYHRLKRFAIEDAARASIPAPAVPTWEPRPCGFPATRGMTGPRGTDLADQCDHLPSFETALDGSIPHSH